MTDTQINAFLAVAETGGFSRAAERLMVSQPAVSLHVGELERSLQVQLFDRLPRGTRLTDAGRMLLDHARRLAAVRAQAERAMADLRGLARGRLAVAASLTVGVYLLPAALGRFRDHHPGVELSVLLDNTDRVQQHLRDGTADVGLTEGDPGGAGITSVVFAHDELVAVVPRGHPLAGRSGVTAAEFCACPVLAREVGSGTRAVTERALAGRGVVLRPALTLPSVEAIVRSVAAGLGVALVSRLAAALDLAGGRVVHVPLRDLAIRRPLHAERATARSVGPAAAAFLSLLVPPPTSRRRREKP